MHPTLRAGPFFIFITGWGTMKILLTNDDGITAPGLGALHGGLAGDHELVVVAPDRERSAVGHGITLHDPIRLSPAPLNGGEPGYAVSGTPADCVKLAVAELLDDLPEIVISGINPGANVGIDINYSGTVAAAREAAFLGIPAISVSMVRPGAPFFHEAAHYISGLLSHIESEGIPKGTFLNVNLPHCSLDDVAGVRLRHQNTGVDPDAFEKRIDPRDQAYYWHRGFTPRPRHSFAADGDRAALAQNYICITPIKCDTTDYPFMESLNRWRLTRG
jgi:5'-nucleotidase